MARSRADAGCAQRSNRVTNSRPQSGRWCIAISQLLEAVSEPAMNRRRMPLLARLAVLYRALHCWASQQWHPIQILQLLLVLFALALPAVALAGDDTPRADAPGDKFAEYLASGEFGLARQLIEKSPAADRNARFAQLAAAQAHAGARNAAIETVALLDDDLDRSTVLAQIGAFPGQNARVPFGAPVGVPGGLAAPGAAPAAPPGAQGGGVQADFTSLIDLITSTIAPTTWEEVGGQGAIESYRNGVFVDAEGVLRRATKSPARADLVALRRDAAVVAGPQDVRRASKLRKVSLPRLERALQLGHALGRGASDTQRALAGLERIDYVLLYPDSRDLVIAGPAAGWTTDAEGRAVSETTGRPCLRLDDLVVLWRHNQERSRDILGCTINPSAEGLAAAKAYLDGAAGQGKPAGRKQQLEQLRRKVGLQTIEVFGIDGRTTAARTLVAADYHMKLIGMGIEQGVAGVPSYLEIVAREDASAVPALDVLRWWFTLACEAVESDGAREAFALRGIAVRLQGENEFLNATGRRVPTGAADELNQRFAANFNEHYAELAARYPVYAELENLFALELVGALVTSQRLDERAGWHRAWFGIDGGYLPESAEVPRAVETVAASQRAGARRYVAGVSGGIHADPWPHLSEDALADGGARLDNARQQAAPAALDRDRWWWD
ncbi:MAG: DUF1598 domain-containing protein [Pirellulales bacterium]|nr:DUF1598 domain-containing protein [Pirellulales bacterium]